MIVCTHSVDRYSIRLAEGPAVHVQRLLERRLTNTGGERATIPRITFGVSHRVAGRDASVTGLNYAHGEDAVDLLGTLRARPAGRRPGIDARAEVDVELDAGEFLTWCASSDEWYPANDRAIVHFAYPTAAAEVRTNVGTGLRCSVEAPGHDVIRREDGDTGWTSWAVAGTLAARGSLIVGWWPAE